MEIQPIYRCNLCVRFVSETLSLLVNYLGRVHKNDPGFHVLCGIEGCAKTFTKFYSLRNHYTKKHRYLLDLQGQGEQPVNLCGHGEQDDDDVREGGGGGGIGPPSV